MANKKLEFAEGAVDLHAMRHSCEHLLMMAMHELYPGIVMAMGPATESGFYFDFEYDGKISESDFPKIEKRMKKIAQRNLPFVRKEVEVSEARGLFADNVYKQDWLDGIEARGEKVSIYWTGDKFVDLCAGPHVDSTKQIGAFKLLSVAGAYWHGDEKNKMLARIYGISFPSKKELKQIAKFLVGISKDLPWHISAFYPCYKMLTQAPTSQEALISACEIGKKAGLQYVYTGNIPNSDYESTFCPKCNALIIERWGMEVLENNLENGKCSKCNTKIQGKWK